MKLSSTRARCRQIFPSLVAFALIAPAALTASADELPRQGFDHESIRALLDAQAVQSEPTGETQTLLLSFTDANGTFETASPAATPAGSTTSTVDSWWNTQTNLSNESTGNGQALARLSAIEKAVEATLDSMAPMPAGVGQTTQNQATDDGVTAVASQGTASSSDTSTSAGQANNAASPTASASPQSSTAFESIATSGFVFDSADYTIWADNFSPTTNLSDGSEECAPDMLDCTPIDSITHCPGTLFDSSCAGSSSP